MQATEIIMIYYLRHGATDWNENKNEQGIKDPKCQGRIDIPLNEKGLQQALKAQEILKDIEFDRVICSPLTRAIQTCQIAYMGNAKIEIDNRLIERDFGEFEGTPRSQFNFKAFNNLNAQNFKYAETLQQVEARVFSLLDELSKKPEQNVLIVSHGGLGCVFTSYFKGYPENGDYSLYELPHGKPAIFNFLEKQL